MWVFAATGKCWKTLLTKYANSYENARNSCESHDAEVGAPDDEEDLNFILNMGTIGNVVLGATDIEKEGIYMNHKGELYVG